MLGAQPKYTGVLKGDLLDWGSLGKQVLVKSRNDKKGNYACDVKGGRHATDYKERVEQVNKWTR